MKFTSVAIIALAAGVQASSFKQNEPAANHGKFIAKAVGTAATAGTAVSTGTHPIMTGTSGTNGTNTSNNGTSSVHGGAGASTVPVSVPSSTPASGASGSGSSSSGSSGSGSSGSGSSSGSAAKPSSSGFVPSSPGTKVSVSMVGAALGSVAYGALIFLA